LFKVSLWSGLDHTVVDIWRLEGSIIWDQMNTPETKANFHLLLDDDECQWHHSEGINISQGCVCKLRTYMLWHCVQFHRLQIAYNNSPFHVESLCSFCIQRPAMPAEHSDWQPTRWPLLCSACCSPFHSFSFLEDLLPLSAKVPPLRAGKCRRWHWEPTRPSMSPASSALM
jgi:hypothetical protein